MKKLKTNDDSNYDDHENRNDVLHVYSQMQSKESKRYEPAEVNKGKRESTTQDFLSVATVFVRKNMLLPYDTTYEVVTSTPSPS